MAVDRPVLHVSREIEAKNANRMKKEDPRKNIDFSDSRAASIAISADVIARAEKKMNNNLSWRLRGMVLEIFHPF